MKMSINICQKFFFVCIVHRDWSSLEMGQKIQRVPCPRDATRSKVQTHLYNLDILLCINPWNKYLFLSLQKHLFKGMQRQWNCIMLFYKYKHIQHILYQHYTSNSPNDRCSFEYLTIFSKVSIIFIFRKQHGYITP